MPNPLALMRADVRDEIPHEFWDAFWARVDHGAGDVCWYWREHGTDGKRFAVSTPARRWLLSPRLVAWELLGYGPTTSLTLLNDRARCGNEWCVRPDHVVPHRRRRPRPAGVLELLRLGARRADAREPLRPITPPAMVADDPEVRWLGAAEVPPLILGERGT